MKLITQKDIDAISDPALLKNPDGVAIACNQAYLDFRKISSQELLGHYAYKTASRAQADLHALASRHLLNLECSQFEYEGFKEATPIKITISRVQFTDEKFDAILLIIRLEPILPVALGPKINLTTREHAVLQLIIQGNSQKGIAQILALSHHTIAGYLKAIYIKLGVKSSTQAVLIATSELGMRSQLQGNSIGGAHLRKL